MFDQANTTSGPVFASQEMRGNSELQALSALDDLVNRRTDCPTVNLVLRLHTFNRYGQLCVTLTWLGTTAMLATLTLDRYKEKTVESDSRLSIF